MSATIISGRVWKFGDNINTDLMLPGDVHAGSEEEQAGAVFRANRPGWLKEMRAAISSSAAAITARDRAARPRARCAISASPA